jgi:hypothetical protein
MALLGLVAAMACGSSEEALIVEVDVTRFEVPAQLDTLHLELREADGQLVGFDQALEVGMPRPAVRLVRGARTSASPTLVVYGFKDSRLVAQSSAVALRFIEDETPIVRLAL